MTGQHSPVKSRLILPALSFSPANLTSTGNLTSAA
jgi:hypothetical protein